MEDDVHAAFDAAIAKSLQLCEEFNFSLVKIKKYLANLYKIHDVTQKMHLTLSVLLDLPKEVVENFSWTLIVSHEGLYFRCYDKIECAVSHVSFDSIIKQDHPKDRAIILEVFKSMPKLLKDLENQAALKSSELTKLIDVIVFEKRLSNL